MNGTVVQPLVFRPSRGNGGLAARLSRAVAGDVATLPWTESQYIPPCEIESAKSSSSAGDTEFSALHFLVRRKMSRSIPIRDRR